MRTWPFGAYGSCHCATYILQVPRVVYAAASNGSLCDGGKEPLLYDGLALRRRTLHAWRAHIYGGGPVASAPTASAAFASFHTMYLTVYLTTAPSYKCIKQCFPIRGFQALSCAIMSSWTVADG